MNLVSILIIFFSITPNAFAKPMELSSESKECASCHKKETPAMFQQWGASKHYKGKVGCFECHRANVGDKDAFMHYKQRISIIVSPNDCARCHKKEVDEFQNSHHSQAGRILGSLDNAWRIILG